MNENRKAFLFPANHAQSCGVNKVRKKEIVAYSLFGSTYRRNMFTLLQQLKRTTINTGDN